MTMVVVAVLVLAVVGFLSAVWPPDAAPQWGVMGPGHSVAGCAPAITATSASPARTAEVNRQRECWTGAASRR